MNILILNWRDPKNPKSGGAEIVTLGHAKGWVKAGHKVTWFTSKFKNSKDEETIEGVDIVRWGSSVTVFLFAPFFYLFSGRKFDLVIDEIHGIPFFTPFYVRKPKIAFIHEVAGEIWDYMYPFPINIIGKLIESLYFRLYSGIKFWTDADSTIDDLVKYGIKKENCTVINCPIINKSLSELPIKEKNPTFIFVSRIVKMKGVEEVIRAFLQISRGISAPNLWIVGNGDKKYIKKIKKRIEYFASSSRIKFFGYVSESQKLELMKKAHLLLHASVKEGWGLVVIEAASQATPSVVYDVSGLRDSVLNGKTGVILRKNSSEEMAKEVISLLKNKARYRGYQVNALKWAKSLDWKKAIGKSLSLIQSK